MKGVAGAGLARFGVGGTCAGLARMDEEEEDDDEDEEEDEEEGCASADAFRTFAIPIAENAFWRTSRRSAKTESSKFSPSGQGR